MDETKGGISRREALKTTAKAAGAAAFAAPVVVGVFNSSASAALCDSTQDSDAQPATVTIGTSWNANCGQGGRYNGQNQTGSSSFTLNGAVGSIVIADDGTDNTQFQNTYYTIVNPTGWVCSATFSVEGCAGAPPAAYSYSANNLGTWPSGAQSLPFCPDEDCSSVRLVLESVTCCPTSG